MKELKESYYQEQWEKQNLYAYNPKVAKENTFVIDTPPPTISGALHIGHVFSYTQTDILARFQRMQGKNVFYPMGWDNNGLPTERRVQNLYKITCDPRISVTKESISFEEIIKRKNKKISEFLSVSRDTFVRVCSQQTKEDQKNYQRLWKRLALSVDWAQTYETISSHSQIISQRSFLDLYKKGFVENRHTPVYWDTQFKTAVAQADMEDRKKTGFYHDIKFSIYNGEEFVISTTRPELLPACVAVVAHPDDERYKKFFYKQAVTPLFSALVPFLPSSHADPKKGTGALMVCTFGDKEDVKFWENQNQTASSTVSVGQAESVPLKQILDAEGFLRDIVFKPFRDNVDSTKSREAQGGDNVFRSLKVELANKYYGELKGLRVQQARSKIRDMLKETKHLVSDPKPTEHFVKFYEKGDYPLEIIPTRQWYIKILPYKKELLEQGLKVKWHPPSMYKRYEQWVEGLNQDWCLSRQRFFGVPFPVWYPLDKNKIADYKNPILPYSSFFSVEGGPTQAVDSMSSCPADWDPRWAYYTEDKRGEPGGFIAEEAVMDTWGTSSLTPQINSHWGIDEERHQKLFPADLRPQAHEIIRTWAFYTIVKSFFHGGKRLGTVEQPTNSSTTFVPAEAESAPRTAGVDLQKGKRLGTVEQPTNSSTTFVPADSGDVDLQKGKRLSTVEQPTNSSTTFVPPDSGVWEHIAISGWVMNPQRLKISKSKGGKGGFSPEELMDKYSPDAIRYWAGKARLGVDTVYDENVFKVGKKLTIKLQNAFKFIQIQIEGMERFLNQTGRRPIEKGATWEAFSSCSVHSNREVLNKINFISVTLDQAWMMYVLDTHRQATALLKQFYYAEALSLIEKAFWLFCDNYIELVKSRAYQFTKLVKTKGVDGSYRKTMIEEQTHKLSPALRAAETKGVDGSYRKTMIEEQTHKLSPALRAAETKEVDTSNIKKASSAVHTLDLSMYFFVKMLAPYLPYTTEHIWHHHPPPRPRPRVGGDKGCGGVLPKDHDQRTDPQTVSVHLADWGDAKPWLSVLKKQGSLNQKDQVRHLAFYLLEKVRSQKAGLKKSLSAPVREIKINMDKESTALFEFCCEDLARATHVSLKNIKVETKAINPPEVFITME